MTTASAQQLHLIYLVVEVTLPNCQPTLKQQVLQSMGRKQLRPLKSDVLSVFQVSHMPPHAFICLTRNLERALVISEHGPTAEQYALKFRNTLLDKLKLYAGIGGHSTNALYPSNVFSGTDASTPYRASNYVAKASILQDQTNQFIDLFAMSKELKQASMPNTLGVFFDADEYPAIVWIESAPSRYAALQRRNNPDMRQDDTQIRTLVYPSGVVITHGTDNPDALLEYFQRKLLFILRFVISLVYMSLKETVLTRSNP